MDQDDDALRKYADWASAKSDLNTRRANNEEMRRIAEATALAEGARWKLRHYLFALLLVLAGYFLSTAFFDRVNFFEGAKILGHNALQIPGVLLFAFFSIRLINKSAKLAPIEIETTKPSLPEKQRPGPK